MKGKFKVGDKVVISPKYRDKYNCITTVGTVTKVSFNDTRRVYVVKFEGKRFETYFFSYELELAPKEKIEIHPLEQIEAQKKEGTPKNESKSKPIQIVYFRPQDIQQKEQEKPKFKVGDSVFLTPQAIEWLKDNDHCRIIDPADYYKPFKVTQSLVLPYGSEERISYRLNNKYTIVFFEEDLTSTRQAQDQTSIDLDTLNRLKKSWITISNIYLHEFCRRHDFSYNEDMWISGNPGTTAEVCDMIVSMDDIRYDVDNQIDPDLFQKWYWKSLEIYELTDGKVLYMNYPSFCKGAPDEFTSERMEKLRASKKRMDEAQKDFEETVQQYVEQSCHEQRKKLF